MAYGEATVTAVTLRAPYPADNLFPSDSVFPDATFLPAGFADAVIAVQSNDAHLAATSAGGAALIPVAVPVTTT